MVLLIVIKTLKLVYLMFVSVCFFTLVCLFLLRRRVDSFFIAALGLVIYNFPVFIGLLWYMDSGGNFRGFGKPAELDLQVSILIILVILYVFSLIPTRRTSLSSVYSTHDFGIFWLISVFCILLSVYAVPIASQYVGKAARASSIGYAYFFVIYVFSLGAAFSAYFALCFRKNGERFLALIVFVIILYVSIFVFQARSIVFFSVLAVALHFFYDKKLDFSLLNLRYVLFVFLAGLIFLGKHISNFFIYDVSYNMWTSVFLDSLESFFIASNLNYVYGSGVSSQSLIYLPLNILPLTSEITIDYHDIVKQRVFPDASFGLGRSPIGEAWINIGWVGIIFYSFVLALKCMFFDHILRRTSGLLKIFFLLLALISLFYVNRNSIQTDIVFVRNYFIVFSLFVLLNSFVFRKYVIRISR
jgi:hypothetical protein